MIIIHGTDVTSQTKESCVQTDLSSISFSTVVH
jgi:hypothetical protein